MASFDFGSIIPSVGFGMSMFGTGMDSMGAYQAALAENQATEWNATVNEQNADLADKKADIFRLLGETEKEETIAQYRALGEQQRSEYGASGVDVNAGSPLLITSNTAATGVYEGQKSKYQRDLQAWEMDNTARGLRMEAEFARVNKRSPWLSAASAGVGGLTNAFATWGKWK